MNDIASQFEAALERAIGDPVEPTVGAAAGWCRQGADPFDRGIVYAGNVDYREGGGGTPDDDTLWEIGSVSKTFTAALLALAAAREPQLLTRTVEQDIEAWLGPDPSPPPELATITYNRLVSMSAGLVDVNRHVGGATPGDAPPTSPRDGSFPVADLFLNLLEPGSYTDAPCSWLYSDLSIALLGWALTSVYGVAPEDPAALPEVYLELLCDRLLDPLGIAATWAAGADPAHLPVGWIDGHPTEALDPDWPANDPAGALTLAAPDLLAWVDANLRPGAMLGGDALQLLRTPFLPTGVEVDTGSGGVISQGGASCRGWFLIPSRASRDTWLYNKNGRVRGFVAAIAYAPPPRLDDASPAGVFVAINDADVAVEPLVEELLAIVTGAAPEGNPRADRRTP